MRYRFQFRRYRLPFRQVIRTAHGPWGEREGILIRLENEMGRVGFGEAAPIPWFGTESADDDQVGCEALHEWVESQVLDAVPDRLSCLRHAIDIARGEIEETSDTLPAQESVNLGVAALLPSGRAAIPQLSVKADAGFRVFKWKVGIADPDLERGWLDEVCSALPDGAKLRLDANGAWDIKRAARWLELCADRPVEFVEQPLAPDSKGAQDALLGLAADFPTPVALDESLVSDGDVDRWVGAGWPGVYVVKPSLLRRPKATLEKLSAAAAAVVFSSALETALGARTALKHAFEWKGERRALGFGVWPLFANSIFDGPLVTPFLSWSDVARIKPAALWNALS
jgi:O-succinylbenzoate synthase